MRPSNFAHDDGGRDEALCERHEVWHDSGEVCWKCWDRHEEAKRIKRKRLAERSPLYSYISGLGEIYKQQAGI